MRSLFAKILVLFLGTTLVSLAAYVATSTLLVRRLGPDGFHGGTTALILDDARRSYEEGGPALLAAYLRRVDRLFRNKHYLIDPANRDLVTGEDRSDLLARARPSSAPRSLGEQWRQRGAGEPQVIVAGSDEPHFRLITVLRPRLRQRVWDFWPFYLLILLVITFLSYILAVHLVRPLRKLRRSVERFGRGELSVRSHSTRIDEIGDLSRAFDRMAERIETLLHAERRLLQDVSHELRSPLARLHFAVELARTSPDRESALTRIRKEADRLGGLVDELLQLTRAEGDPSSREIKDVLLHEVLQALVEDNRLEAEMHHCRIDLRVPHPVYLRGEPELIRRAVENVLRNAIRHAPEGTSVEVHLDLHGGSAMIRIRDFGPGVPEELLEEIFKPFFRVEDDRDRASGGVGLGLSIARRAVDLHQGTITARNARPGLLVTLILPNAREDPEEASSFV
jgi:two-component system sensor histidine kinase CpxA